LPFYFPVFYPTLSQIIDTKAGVTRKQATIVDLRWTILLSTA
jgi:hypothetical protein